MTFLYRAGTWAYALLIAILTLLRWPLGKRDDVERLGLGLPQIGHDRPVCWFVASSVGEVLLAVKLINRLRTKAEITTVLTVTTATGRAQALASDCQADCICYHPLDVSLIVRRFLKHFQPSTMVMVETELWPVLMTEALSAEVNLCLVAGRISASSHRRYLPFRPLFAPLLSRFSLLLMQSRADAERITQLGGRTETVDVLGSPKSEYVKPEAGAVAAMADCLMSWSGKKLFVCGSTRPGEETVLLDAYVELASQADDLRLVLAPRHPARVDEVQREIERRQLSLMRRSAGRPEAGTQVLLLDTMGELNLLYHLAQIAFVGGTLADLGGHNLLEPALAGSPVLFGPHYYNQQPGTELVLEHELGTIVRDSEEIRASVAAWLASGDSRVVCRARVERLRSANADLLDRYVSRIIETLSGEE